MSRHIFTVALCGLILIAVGSAASNSLAQSLPEHTHPLISPDTYGHVLDVAFSHEELDTSQLQYSIVLRFMSSRHTESEVVVSVLKNGTAQATLFKVSGPSAWNVANDYLQKTGNADLGQIAKLIQTTEQVVSVPPSQAALWYSGLLKSIEQSSSQLQLEMTAFRKTSETTVFLDGSTYELWLQQGLTQVHWTAMDEEVDDLNPAGHSFIARWMNDVRRFALSHAAK